MNEINELVLDNSLSKKQSIPYCLLPGLQWVWVISLAVFLSLVSFYNYLLFHTLVELIAIIIAVLFVIVIWQTYPISENHYLMYLGAGYFWVAALDFLHTLVYKGMYIFPISDSNPATQFWISARYFEALVLLTAPIFLNRSFKRVPLFFFFATLILAIYLLIMTANFPNCFIEGKGLTDFKVYSEYLIIIILCGAFGHMWYHHNDIDRHILALMSASIIFTMCAELAFTFYVNVYGLSNLIGHIFKLFSYWFIYQAIVCTTLEQPMRVMSKKLQNEIAERKKLEEKLRFQAAHDPLTGLYNRHIFESRMVDEVNRAMRYNLHLSAFMLDFDHFKRINDKHGHQAGDRVLSSVARLLESSVRNSDYIARYGGEEFVVILPETNLAKAVELAERLRNKIAMHLIALDDKTEIRLTVSIGVVSFPQHGKNWPELLEIADMAMYAAKKEGRNRVNIGYRAEK